MNQFKCVAAFRSSKGKHYYNGETISVANYNALRSGERQHFREDVIVSNNSFSNSSDDSSPYLNTFNSFNSLDFGSSNSGDDFSGFGGGDSGGGGASGDW